MEAGRIHLDLDLDLGSDPVTGELSAPGRDPKAFTGYAGLIAALDGFRGTDGAALERGRRAGEAAAADGGTEA